MSGLTSLLFLTAPVLQLSDVEVDRCGQLHGVLHVRPKGRDRVVEVHVDHGGTPVHVPAGATEVPFVTEPGDRVWASWRFVDTAVVHVPSREPNLGLSLSLPADWVADQPVSVGVDLAEACRADDLRLVATVDGAVVHRGPVEDVAIAPAEGVRVLALEVHRDDLVLDTMRTTLVVGPPCVDGDGDGAPQCRNQDCDDTDPRVYVGAPDVVGNGLDENCDGMDGTDRDRDGQLSAHDGGPDCDDTDPTIPRPEAPVPTGVDEDCDGLVDEGTVAFDDDGDGLSEQEGDCHDGDPTIHPGAAEVPDCRDQDCDGLVDEGAPRPERDDRYEPNDAAAAEVPGAYWVRGLFGGRYKPSSTRVRAVTRNLDDVERFEVFAHDGDLDTFHVTVRLEGIGDDRAYEVAIGSEGRWTRGVLEHAGDVVSLAGQPGSNDTGTYVVELRPLRGDLGYCPVQLQVSSG